jgi:Aminoglycoside-2''-adenylyltransferase
VDRSPAAEGEPMPQDPPWAPWSPAEVARRLADVRTRWYVVAGWSIDLHLGTQTRPHDDIEIGVPREGFASVRSALGAFDCDVVGSVVDGEQGRRWPLESPAFDEHFQTWFRDRASGTYHLDVFRDPHDGDTWLCRRDTSIRLPYDDLVLRTDAGIPYMAPEVVLLFKAKGNRPKDRVDLAAVLPSLSPRQLTWLRGAVATVHPGHPWLTDVLV